MIKASTRISQNYMKEFWEFFHQILGKLCINYVILRNKYVIISILEQECDNSIFVVVRHMWYFAKQYSHHSNDHLEQWNPNESLVHVLVLFGLNEGI